MRQFSLSANIETGVIGNDRYIVTPNVQKVVGEIISNYQAGIHSFSIVGTYGTGKSSFLIRFQEDLKNADASNSFIPNPKVLTNANGFEILNIVGDYQSLESILSDRLDAIIECEKNSDCIDKLRVYYQYAKRNNKMFILIVDEFGKVLEHAAKENPEKELYFMQRLAEFMNVPQRNGMLLVTLHQNFSSYSSKLTDAQRNEWIKVKGRFQEIVFAEPIEQLLFLAAEHLEGQDDLLSSQIKIIHKLALSTKFSASTLTLETALRLSPLDAFAAVILTKAIQKYGQNERSLFSFLAAQGEHSLIQFDRERGQTFHLADVYDYVIDHFHTYLMDANAEMGSWAAIQSAIERVETTNWKREEDFLCALRLVKSIGLLNMFGNAGFSMTIAELTTYAESALGINEPVVVIQKLIERKIIRYAEYRHRFVLFEGTDFHIEEEVIKASAIVPVPVNIVDDLRAYFNHRAYPARACYYHRGTPRYFEITLLNSPVDIVPRGDVDGYIQLIFSTSSDMTNEIIQFTDRCEHAIIVALFERTDEVIKHLHNIQIYEYILERVLIDKSDRIALKEIVQLKTYEKTVLNSLINEGLFAYNSDVKWYFHGKQLDISNQRSFNTSLSLVCNEVYSLTPVIQNELFNKHKLSSTISAARVRYLQALIDHETCEDLGFETTKFPPEKAIYYTLLKNTGIHCAGEFAERPTDQGILPLWNACEHFLRDTKERPKKISELIQMLSMQPYQIKQGVLDFWIPTYLYIKRQDYALFGKNGSYIPTVNMEFFELLKKYPEDFSIKAFAETGIKMSFFNQYRKFIHQGKEVAIKGDAFVETIRPFFFFYNHLNTYAKHTKKLNSLMTLRFREVLKKAKDPEKTFFVDLPNALGYEEGMSDNVQFVEDYCNRLQNAVRELRSCYGELINRIESRLLSALNLGEYPYEEYIVEIHQRFSHVKTCLLTEKQLDFFNHVMTNFDDRQEWYQSICYVILDHPLEQLRDEEEDALIDNLIFLFKECERQAILSQSIKYQVNPEEQQKAEELAQKIEKLLSGDNNLDVYTLSCLLKKRML